MNTICRVRETHHPLQVVVGLTHPTKIHNLYALTPCPSPKGRGEKFAKVQLEHGNNPFFTRAGFIGIIHPFFTCEGFIRINVIFLILPDLLDLPIKKLDTGLVI
jgi:hypothetical protein